MPQNRLLALLRALAASQTEFIVVGGLAAVLRGAPVQTYDVDIVYAQNPENVTRLLDVLASIEAIFRIQPERRIKPSSSHLLGGGHLNFLTTYGPLDLLASIGENLRYHDLLHRSSEQRIGDEIVIQVLDLETLIEIKERLGGEKDNAVLPLLRRTLSEAKKQKPQKDTIE